MAAFIGMRNQELLSRNEYLVTENRILIRQLKGRLLLPMPYFLATPETDAPSRHVSSTMRLLSAALKLRRLPCGSSKPRTPQ